MFVLEVVSVLTTNWLSVDDWLTAVVSDEEASPGVSDEEVILGRILEEPAGS